MDKCPKKCVDYNIKCDAKCGVRCDANYGSNRDERVPTGSPELFLTDTCLPRTNFPYNIYNAMVVEADPYYKRDINNPYLSAYEFLINPNLCPSGINPRLKARWGWMPFPNGYGQGIHIGKYNCYACQDPDPEGFSPFQKSNNLYLKQC